MPFDHTLQQTERAQEGSYHDAGPPRAQRAIERNERLDGPENAHAEDRPDHVTNPTREQGSTNDRGGDGIEFHAWPCKP